MTMGSTCSRTKSRSPFAWGAPSRRAMLDTRGSPRATLSLSWHDFEKPTSRMGGSDGLELADRATIWGKWQWKVDETPERATKTSVYGFGAVSGGCSGDGSSSRVAAGASVRDALPWRLREMHDMPTST